MRSRRDQESEKKTEKKRTEQNRMQAQTKLKGVLQNQRHNLKSKRSHYKDVKNNYRTKRNQRK